MFSKIDPNMPSFNSSHFEKPRAWLPKELGQDSSWIHHLSREATLEIEEALQHAKATEKSWSSSLGNHARGFSKWDKLNEGIFRSILLKIDALFIT